MQLAHYMQAEGLDDAAMAARLGADVSRWAVFKWRYGQRVPRRPMQRRIEAATGGQVTMQDLVAAVDEAAARSDSASRETVSADTRHPVRTDGHARDPVTRARADVPTPIVCPFPEGFSGVRGR